MPAKGQNSTITELKEILKYANFRWRFQNLLVKMTNDLSEIRPRQADNSTQYLESKVSNVERERSISWVRKLVIQMKKSAKKLRWGRGWNDGDENLSDLKYSGQHHGWTWPSRSMLGMGDKVGEILPSNIQRGKSVSTTKMSNNPGIQLRANQNRQDDQKTKTNKQNPQTVQVQRSCSTKSELKISKV